ncbi:Sulfide dehydrogenase subunit alpha [Candidatus Tiddalikarchaeum anstoanum]|nr:Sulfide dehydrogenase subunit alpha [Candidatus Tiddalikarchaeum anstoanum]
MAVYDFLIIGGGPGGLSASIYASRFRMNAAVITEQFGGVIVNTHIIENYPGFYNGTGMELMAVFKKQVEFYKVPIIEERVLNISRDNSLFIVKTAANSYQAKSVLIATGTSWRKLDVKGAKEFEHKGVSYCALCDAPLFKDKVVGVVGGSDSAAKEALLLSEYAKKVYIIYRGENVRAEPINAERVRKNKKIEIITKTNVVEVKGDDVIREVVFDTGKSLKLNGLFIEIGSIPNSLLLKDLGVKVDDKDQIVIGDDMQTNIPGVFAAGDVTINPFKQVITAAYQGSKAANSAYQYLKR